MSVVGSFNLSALTITGGVFALNLAAYTAYDKATKTIVPGKLWDVLFFRKGLGHTVVEINKVLALSGLTVAAIAFLPVEAFRKEQAGLLEYCLYSQVVHGIYSIYKYYGPNNNVPPLGTWPSMFSELLHDSSKTRLVGFKKLSSLLGVASLGCIAYAVKEKATTAVSVAALALGTAHFYTMEVDYKMNVKVRPYGLLPFFVAPLSIGCLCFGMNNVL